MAEIMVRFDDLRRYCENRHCGSVPLEYIKQMRTISDIDRAAILRLLDEADDIVSALYRQGANKDYKCKSLREKLKAIAAEITAPPKSNGDRIRQMTDEELASEMGSSICEKVENCENDLDCDVCRLQWLQKEADEDACARTD